MASSSQSQKKWGDARAVNAPAQQRHPVARAPCRANSVTNLGQYLKTFLVGAYRRLAWGAILKTQRADAK
jgi:hypothetical protein